MNKAEKIQFAKEHFAARWNIAPARLDAGENSYIETDKTFFEIMTFGRGAILRGHAEMLSWCEKNVGNLSPEWMMDSDALFLIEQKLREYDKKLAGEHVRYLHLYPERKASRPDFEYRMFEQGEIEQLYDGRRFDNAFNFERDVLAIAAYSGGEIASIAGVDDYEGELWQIGIDTVPEYRGKGLAAYLVGQIALEIEKRGKVAYYTTWSANLGSTKVALQSGFFPVWMGYPSQDLK